MGTYIIKTPDIGEGIAEVELVAWHVREGDTVVADQVLADVMTDKATVEIPSPVAGRVLTLGGRIGHAVAVGSELIRLEVEGEGNLKPGAQAGAGDAAKPAAPSAFPVLPTFAVPPPRQLPARSVRQAIEAAAAAQIPTGSCDGSPHCLAGRAPPRLGVGHPAGAGARHRSGRAHRAGRSGRPCPSASRPGAARAGTRGARCAGRGGAGAGQHLWRTEQHGNHPRHRPAPQDRDEDAGGQAAHPAFQLHRGSRRHRAGGAAPAAQCALGRKAPTPDAAAPAGARHGAGACASSRRSTPASTTRWASSRATGRCTWALPRRPATA